MSPIVTVCKPVNSLIKREISVPGSKYIANRLLIIATLAQGESVLHNFPQNKDIEIAGEGVRSIGATINKNGSTWKIQGTGGKIKSPASVFTGENGTFSRFAIAVASLGNNPIRLDSAPRMKERPIGDILEALRNLGVTVEGDTFPITLTGPLHQGEAALKGNVSSQFFSALALTLPYALPSSVDNSLDDLQQEKGNSRIHIRTSLVSENYLTMTLNLMREFGVDAHLDIPSKKNFKETLFIPQGEYLGREYTVEADVVSSTYFMALAALSGESLTIRDYPRHSVQGEGEFPSLLEKMGCSVENRDNGLTIHPPSSSLRGINVDMTHMPDAAPTLAVLSACAVGKSRINGISHLRHKESNRVEDIAIELRKAGIKVKTGAQFMEIEGGTPCPALFDSHNDHRLVMSLSLLALKSREVKIKNYQAVEKSFPDYFEKLQSLGITVSYY